MSNALPILLEYITGQNWAMNLSTLRQMVDVVERHVKGQHVSDDELKRITAAKEARGSDQRKFMVTDSGMAIIPVSGVIAKYSRLVNGTSKPRGTSIEALRDQFGAAMTDGRVSSIFLQIESPGGNLDGLADFAADIYKASFEKPIVAFADDWAASAAYWIGSQANVLYANQTAEVGSIGVYAIYIDSAKYAESLGLKFHIVRSGPNKGVGQPGVEISEENLSVIQSKIDAYNEIFIAAVMRGRGASGLTEEQLRILADGRTYVGQAAADNKLVDGICTLEQAIDAELPEVRSKGTFAAAGASAEKSNTQILKENEMSGQDQQSDAAASEQIRKEAAADERKRIEDISGALEGDAFADVRNKAIAGTLSVTEAKAMAFDVAIEHHKTEMSDLQVKLDEAGAKLDAIATGGSNLKAQGTSDEGEEEGGPAGADDGKAETYEKAVAHYQMEAGGKLSKAKATAKAAKELPKSHEAWKGAQGSL